MHPKSLTIPTIAAVAAAAAGALLLAPSAANAANSATPSVFFGGRAYGSTVGLGSLVRSGETAKVPMCTSRVGATHADQTAALHVPGLGTIGAVTTRISSGKRGSTLSTLSTSHTATTSLLGGLIRLDAISTTARQAKRGNTYPSVGDTTLVNLKIAGRAVPVHPRVNQTIAIPGVGSVLLNHQSRSSHGGQHSLKVTALRLTLSTAVDGLPKGEVTIGSAQATLHAPTYHRAYGSAYGTTIEVGGLVKSGRTAPVSLTCGGSTSAVSDQTAAVHANPALALAAVASRASSTDKASGTTATSRSRITGVNLLSGVVTVQAITVQAHVARSGTHLSRSSQGTSILGLRINGRAIQVPPSSTKRSFAGLGTLYFDSAINTKTGLQVYALRLVLSTAQDGLAKGTSITVGSALAGVQP